MKTFVFRTELKINQIYIYINDQELNDVENYTYLDENISKYR